MCDTVDCQSKWRETARDVVSPTIRFHHRVGILEIQLNTGSRAANWNRTSTQTHFATKGGDNPWMLTTPGCSTALMSANRLVSASMKAVPPRYVANALLPVTPAVSCCVPVTKSSLTATTASSVLLTSPAML